MQQSRTIKFAATAEINLEIVEHQPMPVLKGTSVSFQVSEHVNFYIDAEEMPTHAGYKAMTQAFICGLAANIHAAHNFGFWDSAEHLRYVINQLTEQFVLVAHVEVENMKGEHKGA